MNKKGFTEATVILVLIGLFAVVFYSVVYYFVKTFEDSVSSNHKKQIVAENVQITDVWTEITPKELFESTRRFQEVGLSIIDDHKDYIGNQESENIDYSERMKIKPEVEIIDENGKTYKFEKGSKHNNLIRFSIDETFHGFNSLPQDIKYKTIRIRSNPPFKCKQVIWYDYTLK